MNRLISKFINNSIKVFNINKISNSKCRFIYKQNEITKFGTSKLNFTTSATSTSTTTPIINNTIQQQQQQQQINNNKINEKLIKEIDRIKLKKGNEELKKQLLELYQKNKNTNNGDSFKFYYEFIVKFKSEDYYKEVIDIYNDYKIVSPNETNSTIAISMMSLYSRIENMEECLKICNNEIINNNNHDEPKPSLMYSILIEGYLKNGNQFKANEFLQQYFNDDNTIDKSGNIKRLGINLLNNGYHSMAELIFIYCDQNDLLDLSFHKLIINGYLKSDLIKARKWLSICCTSGNDESSNGLNEIQCNELISEFPICHLLNQLDKCNKKKDLISFLNSIEYKITDPILFKEVIQKLYHQNQMYKEICELFNKNKFNTENIFSGVDCWKIIMKSWINYEPPKDIKDIYKIWLPRPTIDPKSNNGFDIYCKLMEKCIELQILPMETINFVKFINIELTYINEKSFLYKSTHQFIRNYFTKQEPKNAITLLFQTTERYKEIRESCLIKIIVKGLLKTMETSNNPDSLYESIVFIINGSLNKKSLKIKRITWEGIFRDIPKQSKSFTFLEKLIKNETNEDIKKYLHFSK